MGTKIGWDTLNLRPHSRPGHCEYTLHYDLMSRVTGLPVGHADLERRFREAWQIDMAWLTNDGPVPWAQRGRVTDMGHAEFAADGSDRRDAATCPFATVEEVLAFDAVGEYGLPPMDELVAYYQDFHRRQQAASPDVVLPGGY